MNKIKKLLLILFILGIMLGSYGGIWKQGAKKVVQPGIEQEDEVFFHIIWDASGSMWGRAGGVEKIINSRELIEEILNKVPEDYNLGLRIFGARRTGDITDSYLAVPVSGNNSKDIMRLVTAVQPLGKSPIAYSLQMACNDLQHLKGEKHIVLVSDGLDNGQVNYTEALEEMKNNNILLQIVHVEESTEPEVNNRLKSLALATGGNYLNYRETNEIISVMNQY